MYACSEEPIHRPGNIQPYGALLVLDAEDHVTHASENCAAWLGVAAEACVGMPMANLFRPTSVSAMQAAFASCAAAEARLLPGQTSQHTGALAGALDVTLSQRGVHKFIEIEWAITVVQNSDAPDQNDAVNLFSQLHISAQRLVASSTYEMLCEVLCQEVRALFGYHRALVYRFDSHWHGTVIAESTGEPFTPYLGHKFPESDIPKQARAMFLENCLRMIPNATVPMVPVRGLGRDRVDMTRLQLRAAAPVHLEYMANMQTQASMTLSLRVDDKLWGLVACHHAQPRYLPARLRNASELLTRLASSLLQQKQRQDGEALRQRYRALHTRLAAQMQDETSVMAALCDGASTVNDMNETGGGCAISLDSTWRTLGKVPPLPVCEAILQWLQAKPGQDVTCTEQLSAEVAETLAFTAEASGLVALSLPQTERAYVLWFRPERIRETRWAGNPHKHASLATSSETGETRLHPRKSFAAYFERVRGHGAPIEEEELAFARALRKTIIEVDLARKVESERRLRIEAEAQQKLAQEAVAVREHVLNIVSHDLRNPIHAIELTAEMALRRAQRDGGPFSAADLQKMVGKIGNATKRMRGLVEDILSLSKIQAGQLQLERAPVDTSCLLQDLHSLLEPAAQAHALALRIEEPATPVVCDGDSERLIQALGNLVSNAMKFTPEGGTITLSAAHAANNDNVVFRVQDTGRGVAEKDRENIFQTFWQAEGAAAKKGLGLGLTIVKQIVEAHGGQVWVESQEGRGSVFAFTCPKASTLQADTR